MLPKTFLAAASLAIATGLCAAAVAATSGGSYAFDQTSIAGGGGTASGGTYVLDGTFGQSAAATLTAAPYAMHDGFWAPASATEQGDAIFANGFDP